MDIKNTIIGIFLIIVALALMFWHNNEYKNIIEQKEKNVYLKSNEEDNTLTNIKSTHIDSLSNKEINNFRSALIVDNHERETSLQEEIHTLENDKIIVTFTNRGAAIQDIALKDFSTTQNLNNPFTFNKEGDYSALGISTLNAGKEYLEEFSPIFKIINKSNKVIKFNYLTSDGIEIFREYNIQEDSNKRDPYTIQHKSIFLNKQNYTIELDNIFINLGTAPPIENDKTGEFLNFGYYNNKNAQFIKTNQFQAKSGFLGFGKSSELLKIQENIQPVIWASVKNQFFTSVLTPKNPGVGFFVKPTQFSSKTINNNSKLGITGSIKFNLGYLKPNDSYNLEADYYVGPKEYLRLEKLGKKQDLIMQFGIFGFISKILLILMINIYKIIPNYGMAIIIITFIIKILLWPLTAASTRSSRRMSQVQEPLKILREKYKNNQQKLQNETIKLFKKYKINPAAGCLPIIVQIPIFLSLFWMLRSASELRFASFLWVRDLSMPDTIISIGGFPVNIMPLIMGITMIIQMRITPMPSTDLIQKKIFQFMPFIFLVICYNFPSGLVLYWAIQNLITIIQQKISSHK